MYILTRTWIRPLLQQVHSLQPKIKKQSIENIINYPPIQNHVLTPVTR